MKIIQRIIRKIRKDKKHSSPKSSYLLKDWFNPHQSTTHELFRLAITDTPVISAASL